MKNNKMIILVFVLVGSASLLQWSGRQNHATMVGNLLFVFLFTVIIFRVIDYFRKSDD